MLEIDRITDVRKHLDGVKAVVFDLDDTLYCEKEYVRSGYRAVAEALPWVIDAEQKLWEAFENKKAAIDEVLVSGGNYSEELKQRCLEIYRYHEPNIHFLSGVERMLIQFRKKGYRLGIITDGRPEGQRAKIQALGLEDYVEEIIVTDELGGIEYRKPNEKAFIVMRERFGVAFSEMCYVGDNINKDFIAPQKLGMRCIWFKNTEGIYQP